METLLSQIKSPADLKKLDKRQLPQLAEELRERIVATVATNGGHLGSSLGVVELTIALHRVFSSPRDKIVWDVGHQAYAHKLLTGRQEQFATLRQFNGISGFPKRSESEHDVFDVGHSSTSISAALGMAAAGEILADDGKILAVIGDGSLTAGMAFEGLNHAGHLKQKLVVILNDNEMSISPNVGALSSFLSRKMTSETFIRFKKETEHLLSYVPGIGRDLVNLAKRAEESLKSFMTPGMLFEGFGFDYFGPLDGHNVEELMETLHNVAQIKGPVLLHVLTKKGKGYRPAEQNPPKFHGVGPFNSETGEILGGKPGGAAAYTGVGSSPSGLAAQNLSRFGIKWPDSVEFGRILLGRAIAFSFLGEHMKQYRPFDLRNVMQGLHELFDVMPVERPEIVETETFEQHPRGHETFQGLLGTFCQVDQVPPDARHVTEQMFGLFLEADKGLGRHFTAEKRRQCADIGGYRHLVVIQDDNQFLLEVPCVIQSFESHSGGQRAVADDGEDLAVVGKDLTGRGHTKGGGNRRAGVTHVENIMFAFGPLGKTADPVKLAQGRELLLATGQQLVRIGLMSDVPDNLIPRRGEHPMQCDRQFHYSEGAPEMPAVGRDGRNDPFAQLFCQLGELPLVEFFQIGR